MRIAAESTQPRRLSCSRCRDYWLANINTIVVGVVVAAFAANRDPSTLSRNYHQTRNDATHKHAHAHTHTRTRAPIQRGERAADSCFARTHARLRIVLEQRRSVWLLCAKHMQYTHHTNVPPYNFNIMLQHCNIARCTCTMLAILFIQYQFDERTMQIQHAQNGSGNVPRAQIWTRHSRHVTHATRTARWHLPCR